ncbi:MAG: electron transfer flavoprotein subunit alpha/FixB family protein, partial [Chloroflexi bacterium]|nr:electron transfer flavoprotein subunit alpha/FixB family protein [Chloroflexota bacterium]
MSGILVLGETAEGRMQPVTAELIAAGRSLHEKLDQDVAVAFLGMESGLDGAASEAISYGADTVYVVQDALLAEPSIDASLAAFQQACSRVEPEVVIVGRTPSGRDIGPRLAFRLGAGLAQDCTDLEVDPDTRRVVATRPVYGGNAMARFTFADSAPQVVVLRLKAFEPLEPDPSRTGDVVNIDAGLDPSVVRSRLVETVRSESEGVRLEDARVVVSGGRGLGGPEPFEVLEELARLLGGAVGASRAVCDAGWLDHSYQVGLTGKTVTPDLYITVGISGASQHMAGCSGAKHI